MTPRALPSFPGDKALCSRAEIWRSRSLQRARLSVRRPASGIEEELPTNDHNRPPYLTLPLPDSPMKILRQAQSNG